VKGAQAISGDSCEVAVSFSCSGNCGLCTTCPSVLSGSVTDGPGNYGTFLDCSWIIGSNADISLHFTEFDVNLFWDFVQLTKCSDASCSRGEKSILYSGLMSETEDMKPNNLFTNDHSRYLPFLKVRFVSYGNLFRTFPGFMANWFTTGIGRCDICTSGTYERMKLKVTILANNCQPATAGLYIELDGVEQAGFQVYILQNASSDNNLYLWKYYDTWVVSEQVGLFDISTLRINIGWDGRNIGTTQWDKVRCDGSWVSFDVLCTVEMDNPCTKCPPHSTSPHDSKSISACICEAGWTGENINCIACVAGKYKLDTGPVACTACAAGKHSDAVSASTHTCIDCTAGSYSADDRSKCVLCVNAHSMA